MPNYKSFDDVLKELEMDEDELKRLVSEGQIRAFRDDDRMKFRSEDVRALARQRQSGGPGATDLDLGETALGKGQGLEVVEEETDETLLDLGSLSQDQDFEDTGATSVPTVELADAAGNDKEGTLTEELVFDETDELGGLDFGEGDADATQKIEGGLSLDDDELGLQTEPVEAGRGKPRPRLPGKKRPTADELDELDQVGTLDDLDEAPAPRAMGAGMGIPGPVQIQEQVRYVEIVPNEGMAWKVLTGLTFLLVLFILVTLPALGLRAGKDPMGVDFFGSTGYSLYLKSPNAALSQEPYRVTTGDKRATAVSMGTTPRTVLWPGMDVIRSFNGYSVDSASGRQDAGDTSPEPEAPAETPAEDTPPADG